jgi:hypothetical protein
MSSPGLLMAEYSLPSCRRSGPRVTVPRGARKGQCAGPLRYLPQVLAAGLPPRYCQRLVIIFASDYRRGKYMRKSTCSIGAISHRARSESRVCLLSSRQRESEVDKVHVKCSQAAAAHGLVYPGEGVQAADGGAGREAQQGDPSGQRRRPQRVVRRGVHIHRSTHRRSGQRERAGATLCPVFPGRET